MPSSARLSTTRSTSPTRSGSRAEVISSHSITLGSMAMAKAAAAAVRAKVASCIVQG